MDALIGELEWITCGKFNLITSLVRIMVGRADPLLTQCIEEFQYSWPYSNPQYICGICATWMVEFDQLSF